MGADIYRHASNREADAIDQAEGFVEEYIAIRAVTPGIVSLILSDRYVDVVDENVDIAIRLTSNPIDSFVARRLAKLEYVVCASPAYLASNAPISTLGDLASHNCMVNGLAREAIWRFVRGGEVIDVRVTGRFSVNSSESLRRAVLDGVGIGLLPTFAIASEIHHRRQFRQPRPRNLFANEIQYAENARVCRLPDVEIHPGNGSLAAR